MKIIIDCDPGIDDMLAIFMALANPNVDIVAITTVAGNGSAEQVFINTHRILQFIGETQIPVYHGHHVNLSGNVAVSDGYFGPDSLGGIDAPFCNDIPKNLKSSSLALLDLVRLHPGEIHLVAIGSLTNLALAYLFDNEFPNLLASLSVMGGDRSERTQFNVTPYAECNAYSDPVAWDIVMKNFKLSNNQKIKLIDFTFCLNNPLSIEFFHKLYGQHDGELNHSLRAKLTKMTFPIMKSKLRDFGSTTADPYVMFMTLYPKLPVTGRICFVERVHKEGETTGHTDFKFDDNGNIFLVDTIDNEKFLKKLYAAIRH